MAKFNQAMRGHVAGSMNDRPAPEGSSGDSRFTVNRPSLQRQGEGRRRLDAASLIRLDRIIPDPDQPRTEFDPEALHMLATSIRERGQLQPIRVRWSDATDRYVVIVGERRYRAAIMAGFDSIACIVAATDATPEDILEDQLVENALREDLRPVEQARAYKTLLAARGLTHRQLAERLQIGHASITRALALLDLPGPIQAEVEAGTIAPNTAYELSKVTDPGEQAELAREAAGGKLRRDDIAARARTPRKSGPSAVRGEPTRRTFRTALATVSVESARTLTPAEAAESLRQALGQLEADADQHTV